MLFTSHPQCRLGTRPQTTPVTQIHRSRVVTCAHNSSQVSRRDVLLGTGVILGASSAPGLAQAGPVVLKEGSGITTSSSKIGFEDRVSEFTLPNGMHFIVLTRPGAPVVAAHIYAAVGAWDEEDGRTGLAHLLEHMAFKGTRRVGTRDWGREGPLLDALDEVFYELREVEATQGKGSARAKALRERMAALQAQAQELVVPNAYGALLSREGAVGLNATTSQDATRYFASLPVNKLELWMALEAERFRAPVFRSLYPEKKVIEEERRMRVDDAPLGRYTEQYSLRALATNYRRPIIGFAQDFDGLGRREVANFFAQHYGPRSLTVALVGDVEPEAVRRLATKYWGDWQGAAGVQGSNPAATNTLLAPAAPGLFGTAGTSSSSSNGSVGATGNGSSSRDKFYRDFASAGPLVMLGFPRPALMGEQGVLVQTACDVLNGSRSTRLFGRAVLGQGSEAGPRLLGASVTAGYPGEARPGLALVTAVPLQGDTVERAEGVVWGEIEDLLGGGPAPGELARVKKETRMSLLGAALNNSTMASLLTTYHAMTGSWRGLNDELGVLDAVTPEAVRAAAQSVFARDGAFVGHVIRK